MTSHERLAAAGWRAYALDRCSPDGARIVATLACSAITEPSASSMAAAYERLILVSTS
jgi:hypothetical protein